MSTAHALPLARSKRGDSCPDGTVLESAACRKEGTAIVLDECGTRWSAVNICLAAGYANEHIVVASVEGKEMLVAPRLSVVAEIANWIAPGQRVVALSNMRDESHDFYFSGIGGGALYALDKDAPVPARTVFEGYRSTKRAKSIRANSPAIVDRCDIFIRALTLALERFMEWLEWPGLPVMLTTGRPSA